MKKILVTLCLIWFACCGFTLAKTPVHIAHLRLTGTSHIGSTIVINGGFAVDSNWTKGGLDWTINLGVASHGATAGNTMYQTISPTTGRLYYYTYGAVISAGTLGATIIGLSIGDITVSQTVSGYGNAAGNTVTFSASADLVCDVDNANVYPVTKAKISKGRARCGMDTTH